MKTSRHTEPQIIAILRHTEGGVPVAELCRAHAMSNATFNIYGRPFRCKIFFEPI
ncbi:MAG: Integrase catalytic region [uncultured bacterium]|nr:MAG: Integrase catalytic region [uncultured bacterium]KAF0173666.1 MAG: Integrase catalytic region [Paracoccaceae bacterium]